MGKYGISSNVIDRFCRVYNCIVLRTKKGGEREMMHACTLVAKKIGRRN